MEDRQVMVVGRSRGLPITDSSGELVISCVRTDPDGAWAEFVDRVEAGSWILPMRLRGRLVDTMPSRIVTEWVGSSVDRARLAASVAPAGDDEPSAIAQYLLENFRGDEEIESSLYGELTSGAWTGPESARSTRQIEILRRWQKHTSYHVAVREWAAKLADFESNRRRRRWSGRQDRGF